MEFNNLYGQAQQPKYECLLFDLDDTIYPFSSGLSAACAKNIEDFMAEKLGIDDSKISTMCNLLYKIYGTTMAGLRAIGYEFDYDEYHSVVHGRLPYEKLKPDHVLRNLLMSLPIRKVIFTNANKVHAVEALNRLGLEDCFEGIICFETLNPAKDSCLPADEPNGEDSKLSSWNRIHDHFSRPNASSDLPESPILCKPTEAAFEQALKLANVDPQRTIFFDDSVRNMQAAKRVGFHTVLVGTSQRVKGADFALESIHNIREALPELWKEAEKSGGVRYSSKVTIETSVTA